MFAKLRGGLTFANVVALMALFIALGGTSVAAVALQKNSVKAKHIASNAVTSAKVKDASLKARDFGAGQLPSGSQGLQGSPGSPGAAGSNGGPGASGPSGEPGAAGTNGSPDSPSQVLGKLVQVDGAGSALDADLFDGVSSSAFQRRGGPMSCPAGQYMSEITSDGDVTCAADGTAPTGAAGGDLTGTYPNPMIGSNAAGGAEVTDGSLGQADISQVTEDSIDITFDGFNVVAGACRARTVRVDSAELAVNDVVFPRILLGGLPNGIVMLPNVVGNAGDAGIVVCNITHVDVGISTVVRVGLRRIR